MNQQIPEGYIRVSSILDRYTDFSKINPDVLSKKQGLGTRVHGFCEDYMNQRIIYPVDKDCEPYFESFKKWFEVMVERVISTEQRINDPELFLTGCVDLICVLKGGQICLIDFKIPVNVYKTWGLQTAAYKSLIAKNTDIKVERRMCLQLSPKGVMPKLIEYTSDSDYQLFMQAYTLHRYFS